MWCQDKPGQRISWETAELNCARSTPQEARLPSGKKAQPGCAFTSPWHWVMSLRCHIQPDSRSLLPPNDDTPWPLWRLLTPLWRVYCKELHISWFVYSEHLARKAWEMSIHCGWKINPSKLHISLLFNGTNGWPCLCNCVCVTHMVQNRGFSVR